MHRKPGTDASTRPSRKTVSSKQSVAARPHLDRSAATNQGVLQSLRVGPLRVEVGIVLILLELLLLLLLLVVVRKHGLVRLLVFPGFPNRRTCRLACKFAHKLRLLIASDIRL